MFIYDVEKIRSIEKEKTTIISQTDMDTLRRIRQAEVAKKDMSKQTRKNEQDESESEKNKRNLQWTVIVDKYIEYSNPYCVFMYQRHHFTKSTNISKNDGFFMSVAACCTFSSCACKYHAKLQNDGHLRIDYTGNIIHLKNELHGRPVRSVRREELQEFTNFGVTPGSLYLRQLSKMSSEEKEAGNRNNVGSSPSVFRKISSEGNVKLRRDNNLEKSLQNLKNELAQKIFPAEQISGYLQEISLDPLRLICFTAGGIAAYHNFVTTMPLSWDATGSIVINRDKKTLYYELTMSNIKRGGPSLPIAVMLSESHSTMDIVHWINCFIEKYRQVYGYGKTFPKPPVIHSDRATAFLVAGIQIFNNDETMARYIERCWRIVKRSGTARDIELTVVHACLGHFMKNVKNNASKDLTKKQVIDGDFLFKMFSFDISRLHLECG